MPAFPPLRALQAFEATARHLSVAAAAQELNITPSAVSHQLKALEGHLGVRLLHRLHRRIALTDEGRDYARLLESGFERLARATDHVLNGGAGDVLTLHCPPSFAPAWLVPRIGDFMRRHPDIDLRIHATPEPPEFFRSDTDVEIRYGAGDWPGLDVIPLMADVVMPFGSSALRAMLPPDPEPAHVLNLPLIHSERALIGWSQWCRTVGVDLSPTRGGLRFDRGYLALQAAAEGLGAALESRTFAERDLLAGRIVPLLEGRGCVPAGGHYLVYPAIYGTLPKVQKFRAWVVQASEHADG